MFQQVPAILRYISGASCIIRAEQEQRRTTKDILVCLYFIKFFTQLTGSQHAELGASGSIGLHPRGNTLPLWTTTGSLYEHVSQGSRSGCPKVAPAFRNTGKLNVIQRG